MTPSWLARHSRRLGILVLAAALTGCLQWLHAYQTYLQMSDFDRHFNVQVSDEFTLHFKEPRLYSSDFVALAKLYPSEDLPLKDGRRWRYWFRKVGQDKQVLKPEIKFYSQLVFNAEKKLTDWSFSGLFLEIAPPQFLEVSLRSIAGAEIDKEKQSLRANTDHIGKITAPLPSKAAVLAKLGPPLKIEDEPEQEVYSYLFLLDTPRIEKGYEDNAVSEVKLTFAKNTQALIIMAGKFAGLKVSIDYRKFLQAAQ
jgi:hypothetical protein